MRVYSSTAPGYWLYRGGMQIFDRRGRRALCTTTWISLTPEVSAVNTNQAMTIVRNQIASSITWGGVQAYAAFDLFAERLWPDRKILFPLRPAKRTDSHQLLDAAPEAALRLQRVGAVGSRTYIGHVSLPVMYDEWFVDRPHRRRVDVAALAPLIAAGLAIHPPHFTIGGRTYQEVVFSRRDTTWAPVTEWRLMPNVMRYWHRLNVHAEIPPTALPTYVPPEIP